MSNIFINRTAIIVDDLDFNIQYTDGWYYQPKGNENGGGSHMTNRIGVEAFFQFNGTGIEVWGTVGPWDVVGIPISQYEVNGQSAVKWRPPVRAPGVEVSKVPFYVSPPLEYGQHWLKITNLGNATHPSTFGFDYLIYSIQAPSNSSTSPIATTATSTATASSSSGKTWPIGAIAGGISAVVFVFLVVCGIAVFIIVRRYRQSYRGERLMDNSDGSSLGHGGSTPHLRVDPFLPLPPSYDEAVQSGATTPTSTLPPSSPRTAKRLMS